jgi:glycosyltransferase involved in cell wall biosynthesis
VKSAAEVVEPVPGTAPIPESLSVVVPTFRRPLSLERCLRALAAQTRAVEQIIVVCRADDHAGHDAAASLAHELPLALLTCDEPRLCAQMDLGVAAAIGDVVALTDDDSAPTPQWAERLMSLYREPDVGAVGGRDVLRIPTVDSRPSGKPIGIVTRGGRPLGNHHRQGVGVRDVQFLKGVNLSVRRQLWHVDLDLLGDGNQSHWELGTCLRIGRLGWRVLYDPELLVDHYPEVRAGEPQRGSHDPYSLRRDAHNELYELVRWLPSWQAALAVVRAMMVGSKDVPGIAVGFWSAAHGTGLPSVVAELRASTGGRWLALRARPRRDRWVKSAASLQARR